MADLSFLADEELRRMVERDKRELQGCLEQELCKSTLLLAGSLIEAILVDYFLAFPRPNSSRSEVVSKELATLIDWAEEDKLIDTRTKEISTVIRHYRNLIHPGREYRAKERVDIYSARVAASLVEIVIDEVSDAYANKRGYTAEQAIRKVELDSSFASIFPHIIAKMVPIERQRLFRMIPNMDFSGQDDTTVASFIALHRLLKGTVPEDVLRAEAARVYEHVRNSSKMEALGYLRYFVTNLDCLEADQRQAVEEYLLNILQKDTGDELVFAAKRRVFLPLASGLDNDDGQKRLSALLARRWTQFPFNHSDAFLSAFADQILGLIDWNRAQAIVDKFRPWATRDARAAGWVSTLDGSIIPF